MNKNDILERLMKGEEAQTIADEFAKMLNEANKEYAEKREEVQMKEELQEILDMFVDWLDRFYEVPFERELTADVVIDVLDGIKEYTDILSKMKPMVDKTKAYNPDKTLEDFLKVMKW